MGISDWIEISSLTPLTDSEKMDEAEILKPIGVLEWQFADSWANVEFRLFFPLDLAFRRVLMEKEQIRSRAERSLWLSFYGYYCLCWTPSGLSPSQISESLWCLLNNFAIIEFAIFHPLNDCIQGCQRRRENPEPLSSSQSLGDLWCDTAWIHSWRSHKKRSSSHSHDSLSLNLHDKQWTFFDPFHRHACMWCPRSLWSGVYPRY